MKALDVFSAFGHVLVSCAMAIPLSAVAYDITGHGGTLSVVAAVAVSIPFLWVGVGEAVCSYRRTASLRRGNGGW